MKCQKNLKNHTTNLLEFKKKSCSQYLTLCNFERRFVDCTNFEVSGVGFFSHLNFRACYYSHFLFNELSFYF